MTRYTRGKPTHQRIAKESTSWDELKATPVKSKDSRNKKHQLHQHTHETEGTSETTRPMTVSTVKQKKKKSKTLLTPDSTTAPSQIEETDVGTINEDVNSKKRAKKKRKNEADQIDDDDTPEVETESHPVKQKKKKLKTLPESELSSAPATDEIEISPTPTGDPNVKSEVVGKKKHRNNPNVKGTGDSQVVKIFGQFWVPAEDAKRLQGLVTALKEKGLSRKDISTALQNDRRRAEKAGKRIRDKTCFNCRQFGHVLSDCPKKGAEQGDSGGGGGAGICFKCGSTEHTSRICRRQADKFDFAKCFICSKTGHISRQCPDNKRGIYPSGGSCNKCGESTHLAKDCSKVILSSSNSEPITNPKFKVVQGGDPITSRIANPYASTEYEEDAGDMRNYSLNGKGSFKNQKIRF